MAKNKTYTISDPDAPASSAQTWAIFKLRRACKIPAGDTRKEGWTKGKAAVEIARLIALKNQAADQQNAIMAAGRKALGLDNVVEDKRVTSMLPQGLRPVTPKPEHSAMKVDADLEAVLNSL